MIIDSSNALCGPGSVPGPRLAEGRFHLQSRRARTLVVSCASRGWGVCRSCVAYAIETSFVPRRTGFHSSLRRRRSRPNPILHLGLAAPRSGGPRGVSPRDPDPARRIPAVRLAPRTIEPLSPAETAKGAGSRRARLLRTAALEQRMLVPSTPRPQLRRDDPPNLSILLSGGKETNKDSLSNGE